MKTAEEWLKENCGSEHQYFSFTDVVRKLEEYASQNTLNRDKVMDIRNRLYDKLPAGDITSFQWIELIKKHISELDDLCSLSLPDAQQRYEMAVLNLNKRATDTGEFGYMVVCELMKIAAGLSTKPKEEER